MLLHSLDDGTTRFVGMGTVGELAVLRKLENFLEIAGEFLLLDIKGTEALDGGACDQYISYYNSAPEDYRYASICCVRCSEIDSLSSVVKCGLSEPMLMPIDQLPEYQAFDGPGQYMYFDFLDYYSSIMKDCGESLRIQLDKTVLFKSSTPQVLAMNPEIPVPISNDFCGMNSYIPHQNQDFFNYCFYQTAWYNSITNH